MLHGIAGIMNATHWSMPIQRKWRKKKTKKKNFLKWIGFFAARQRKFSQFLTISWNMLTDKLKWRCMLIWFWYQRICIFQQAPSRSTRQSCKIFEHGSALKNLCNLSIFIFRSFISFSPTVKPAYQKRGTYKETSYVNVLKIF